ILNDVLDFTKIEAGKMQVSASSFPLVELIQGQCSALKPLVDEKNVDLKIDVVDPELEVFQDRSKLLQILTNLLSNAIKFTPDGGMITIRASAMAFDESVEVGLFSSPAKEMFFIEVVDTGVGIPEDDFEIIFEKFRQSNEVLKNDGLTRQYAGTGLGLSIVKELCKLLGGEIKLTSQLGTGSTFRVELPIYFEPSEVEAAAEEKAV
ncbi:MAG: ATP-binding protein, partial [Planctomycetota bacterium]